MKSKLDFSKIAKKILKHRQQVRDHQIIHPKRDWAIGLLFSIILLGAFGWWNVSTYMTYSNTAVTGSVTLDNQVVVYREGQVMEALDRFAAKEQRFNELVEDNRVSSVLPEEVKESLEVEATEVEVEDMATSTATTSPADTLQEEEDDTPESE